MAVGILSSTISCIITQNTFIGDVIQVFDNGSQWVAMSHDNNVLALLDCGYDGFIPIWEYSVDG